MEQNFKIEIAEALFDSSVKVSKDALIWAMSNLPDGKNYGAHLTSVKPVFNHEKDNVFEACGLTESQCQNAAAKIVKHIKRIAEGEIKVSNIVEGVMEELEKDPNVLMVMVVKSIQDALNHAEKMSNGNDELDKMMKVLKMIRKMKGDDKDLDV